jgi:hypothetical protein
MAFPICVPTVLHGGSIDGRNGLGLHGWPVQTAATAVNATTLNKEGVECMGQRRPEEDACSTIKRGGRDSVAVEGEKIPLKPGGSVEPRTHCDVEIFCAKIGAFSNAIPAQTWEWKSRPASFLLRLPQPKDLSCNNGCLSRRDRLRLVYNGSVFFTVVDDTEVVPPTCSGSENRQNESTEGWRELTSTRFGTVALTFSGLGSSPSTSSGP